MNDANPVLSKLLLACDVLGTALNLVSSVLTRGFRRSTVLLALGAGLPAIGELLATGLLRLLRHRTRPRVAGVPVAVVLGWYGVIHGSFVLARLVLERLSLDESSKRIALPPPRHWSG